MSASSTSSLNASVDLSAIDAEIAVFEAEVGEGSGPDTSEFSLADVDALLEEFEEAQAQGLGTADHGAQDTAMVS